MMLLRVLIAQGDCVDVREGCRVSSERSEIGEDLFTIDLYSVRT